MTREEIVLANIDREIGRLQARKELEECEIEGQVSKEVIKLLETTRCEVVMTIGGLDTQRNVSKVINRAIGQFKFREEIASCEVEEDIYKDAVKRLEIILEEYANSNQQFPKMWIVCEVV